ncbi:hypothetical protein ACEU6E_06710 [Halorutilales archaeon Cl-col2-1]
MNISRKLLGVLSIGLIVAVGVGLSLGTGSDETASVSSVDVTQIDAGCESNLSLSYPSYLSGTPNHTVMANKTDIVWKNGSEAALVSGISKTGDGVYSVNVNTTNIIGTESCRDNYGIKYTVTAEVNPGADGVRVKFYQNGDPSGCTGVVSDPSFESCPSDRMVQI